ncbi:MAG: SRPBCC family protein [Bacteroidota bacterium]
MKALRWIGMIALGLVIAFIVAGMVLPKEYHVKRSIKIDAPKELVFEHIQYFGMRDQWSPWFEMDPNIKISLSGTDGTVGAISRWSGNDEVGVGEQELTAIMPMERVESEVRFKEPWESSADAYLTLEDAGESVEVSWGFQGENAFPTNVMMAVMDMDAMIGQDFEKGLGKLKNMCETAAGEMVRGYRVQEVAFPGRQVLMMRKNISMEDVPTFYESAMPTLYGALQQAEVEMDGMPMGIMFSWDENGTTDMAAAIGVKGEVSAPGAELWEIPARNALLIDYYGDYANTEEAHLAMDDYLAAKGLEMDWPVLEEYASDPEASGDPDQLLTKVYYFVK